MTKDEIIEILEKIKDQKVVAMTEACIAIAEAIKLLHKYPDFCEVCWASSFTLVPKGTVNVRKVIGMNKYVICQMYEAERRLNGK